MVYCCNRYTNSYYSYSICHRNVGGEHNKNVKITSLSSHDHNQRLLLYMLAEQLNTCLGRFLECQKCNILVITQSIKSALPDIYIYIHSPLGTVHVPLGIVCICIRQSTLVCVITYSLWLVAYTNNITNYLLNV